VTSDIEVESEWAGFDGSFEGTRRRQILSGLDLSPAERLRWLERRMAELRALQGKAMPQNQFRSEDED
jgi:hypothetical protein